MAKSGLPIFYLTAVCAYAFTWIKFVNIKTNESNWPYQQRKDTLVSFEILPPLKERASRVCTSTWTHSWNLSPPFINVTYHRRKYVFKKTRMAALPRWSGGAQASRYRKYLRFHHEQIQCGYRSAPDFGGRFNINETEDAPLTCITSALIMYWCFVAMQKWELLKRSRWSIPNMPATCWNELVNHVPVFTWKTWKYQQNKILYWGGISWKHFEAPNMENRIQIPQNKRLTWGLIISLQMFFNNEKYYTFVNACREAGITVPYMSGLKPIYTKKQLTLIAFRHLTSRLFKSAKQMRMLKSGRRSAVSITNWKNTFCIVHTP